MSTPFLLYIFVSTSTALTTFSGNPFPTVPVNLPGKTGIRAGSMPLRGIRVETRNQRILTLHVVERFFYPAPSGALVRYCYGEVVREARLV